MIRIGRESQHLPYAGIFLMLYFNQIASRQKKNLEQENDLWFLNKSALRINFGPEEVLELSTGNHDCEPFLVSTIPVAKK